MSESGFCRNCGLELGNDNFCSKCGTARSTSAEPSALPTRAPSVVPASGANSEKPRAVSGTWGQRLQRVLSVRIGCMGLIVAGVAAALTGALWEPLAAIVFWPVLIAFMLAAIFNDENVLNCPHCRKRVKIGASTCHHCGQTVR